MRVQTKQCSLIEIQFIELSATLMDFDKLLAKAEFIRQSNIVNPQKLSELG
jgi:hypothetical protein